MNRNKRIDAFFLDIRELTLCESPLFPVHLSLLPVPTAPSSRCHLHNPPNIPSQSLRYLGKVIRHPDLSHHKSIQIESVFLP